MFGINLKKFIKGFTLIETLLVVAIAAGIFALSAPFALKFYHTQLVEETRSNIVSALEQARHNAVLQKKDSAFGVHFENGNYIIFQGDVYDENSVQNEIFPIVSGIDMTGTTDIVFSKLTGETSTSSTSTIAYGAIARQITVSEAGAISLVEESRAIAVVDGAACEATGGDKTVVGNYTVHTFKTDGDFEVVSGVCIAQILAVAGGGGGGGGQDGDGSRGGGGGGGGVLYSAGQELTAQSYTVTVGSGGSGGSSWTSGSNGVDSSFGNLLTAIGGGGGCGGDGQNGGSGGSGGAGCYGSFPGSGTDNQGYAGGNTKMNDPYPAGAGGGAGGIGGDGDLNGPRGGNGGIGVDYSSIFGTSVGESGWFGGGGSGDVFWRWMGNFPGTPGRGGGGTGSNLGGSPGAPNTGGGGGSTGPGNDGGSGIVIVKYLNIVDDVAPVVTSFTIPSTSASLSIDISTFTATDAIGVSSYLITESASTPDVGDSGWTVGAPASYDFDTGGSKTLYAWAKDMSGNISESVSASINLTITACVATGGDKTVDGLYTIHTFRSSGTFSVTSGSCSPQIFVVAGGGGGGGGQDGDGSRGGGGGGGGVLYSARKSLRNISYPVTVGSGGSGGSSWTSGSNGVDSSFGNLLTAIGGGGGCGGDGQNGGSGGSGGSGCYASSPGLGTSGQGYSGGNTIMGDPYPAGGGGGAGAAGGDGDQGAPRGGNGGIGVDYSSIFGTSVGESGWFGGGGSGDVFWRWMGNFPGTPGRGGGGTGSNLGGSPGAPNTGGGGGSTGPGNDGGSGIVIVKYLTN